MGRRSALCRSWRLNLAFTSVLCCFRAGNPPGRNQACEGQLGRGSGVQRGNSSFSHFQIWSSGLCKPTLSLHLLALLGPPLLGHGNPGRPARRGSGTSRLLLRYIPDNSSFAHFRVLASVAFFYVLPPPRKCLIKVSQVKRGLNVTHNSDVNLRQFFIILESLFFCEFTN